MFNQQKPMDLMDMYIDAKDQVNNWCVAKIIDQDLINLKINIHFDGWSSKYDEVSKYFKLIQLYLTFNLLFIQIYFI